MTKILTIIAVCFLGLSYAQESVEIQNQIDAIDLKCESIDASKSFRVDTLPVFNSTEGRETIWKFDGDQIVYYEVESYGEMGMNHSAYYMENGKLIFVHEEETQYNRPIYYDSIAMVENEDTEYWNPDKFGMRIVNAYFQDTTIIHFTEGGNSGLLDDKEYMKEVSSEYRGHVKTLHEEYALIRRILEMRPKPGCGKITD